MASTVTHQPTTSSVRTVAFASLIGTTIEWYDFFLYGTAAALVFNRLFFPTFDPLMGTLAAFGTYTGFFSEPGGTTPGVPGGVGLSYTLSDGQGVFSATGVAVFRGP